LLHLVGCLYYCISDAWSHKHQYKLLLCRPVHFKHSLDRAHFGEVI